MLNLQWRLQSLDPDASESLRVISFFDSLTEAKAGVDALLRAAATLADCEVGVVEDVAGRGRSASPQGDVVRTFLEPRREWLSHLVATDPPRKAYLARQAGKWRANDELLLERLSLSLRNAFERGGAPLVRSAVEVLINPGETPEARMEAAGRLRLNPHSTYRFVATPFTDEPQPSRQVGVVFSPVGMLRGYLEDGTPARGRAGIGGSHPPGELTASWREALACLQLTTARRPVVRADEYGSILGLQSTAAPAEEEKRFEALLSTHNWAEETIEVLTQTMRLREAARDLGIHHSTLQWRLTTISESLEYEVSRHPGAFRLAVSYCQHLFHTQTF